MLLQACLQILSESDIETAGLGIALQYVNVKELHFTGLPSRSPLAVRRTGPPSHFALPRRQGWWTGGAAAFVLATLEKAGLPGRSSEHLVRSRFSMARLRFAPARQSSPSALLRAKTGGAEGIRTPDLLIANQPLYQLSYDPSPSCPFLNDDFLLCCFAPPTTSLLRMVKKSAGPAITHDFHRRNPPKPAF